MKNFVRILSLFLCCVIILTSSACQNDNEKQYERIALTSSNFHKYICINTYITDLTYEYVESTGYYECFSVLNIETSKKIECTFEDVFIFKFNPTAINFNPISIDYNGDSHSSVILHTRVHDIDDFYTTPGAGIYKHNTLTITRTINAEVSGYVIVEKTQKNIIDVK